MFFVMLNLVFVSDYRLKDSLFRIEDNSKRDFKLQLYLQLHYKPLYSVAIVVADHNSIVSQI